MEIGDQRLHRRVEAVAVAQLDREAFADIARRDAGGVEALDDAQDASTLPTVMPRRSAISATGSPR
jgi:heme oxygenase